jgi:hypothetical protein
LRRDVRRPDIFEIVRAPAKEMPDLQSATGFKESKSRLFRKYALLIGSLVSATLLISGLVEMYSSQL